MEDFEKTPPPPRKRKSRAKNLAGEAAIAPGSDTSSASTEGQTEASGVKVEQVEKRVGEPKVRRSRKPKNVEQRAEASEQTPGGDLDTVQTLPVTSQPTVEEPPQEAPMTSQTETLPTVTPTDMQPDPEVVASKALNSKEKDKEDVSIRVRILQRLLKGSSWMVNVCAAAIVSVLLGFNQPVSHIPILDFIQRNKLTVLVAVCAVVFLTLVVLLASPSLYKYLRPMDARLKAMGAVTSVSILSCMLCLSLLGITLERPAWCPTSLCPAPRVITKAITTTQGAHDANLDVYFISFQSTTYVIPGNPQKPDYIPSSGDPRSIGAMLLDAPATTAPYTIAIGLHSLSTGRYSILIDKVTLLVMNVNAVPDPLHVYPVVLLTKYSTTNPSRFVYQGQRAQQAIADTYSTSSFPRVELTSGESDQIDAAVASRFPVDMHFRIQVTYHIATQEQHTLILPHVFEVVFSNTSNWHTYQLNLARQNFVPLP